MSEAEKSRKAYFKVSCHLDGKQEATLTVEEVRAGIGFIHVRPKGSHKVYTITLTQAAEVIAARAVKNSLPQS